MHSSQTMSKNQLSSSSRVQSHLAQTYLESNSFSQTGTLLSTRRLDMERNMRSNITAGNRPVSKIIFVRVADELKGPATLQFQENLKAEYGDYLFFEYMKTSHAIAKVDLTKQPVCCIVTGFNDRLWAKKFSQNEKHRTNLSIFLFCQDRNTEEYPEIMENFSNDRLKPVASLEDAQALIRIQYEFYSDKYINDVTEKRIRNKFYYKLNTNEVLNIYYEEQLGKLVTPYVNPITSNKRFKKTNFFRFKDIKQLLVMAKGRRNIKRAYTKKIEMEVMASSKRGIATTTNLGDASFSSPRSGPIGGYDQLLVNTNQHKDLVKTAQAQDINYILVSGSNPDLSKIQKFCLSEQNTRMLILDSEKSLRQLKQQLNIFSSENENMDRQRIVMSEKLLIMIFHEDLATRREIEEQENFNFHAEMVIIVSPEQLAAEIWRIHENQNYFGLLILEEDKYAEWLRIIESAIEFGTSRQIDNLKVLIKRQKDDDDDANMSLQYIYDVDPAKTYLTSPDLLAESDQQHSLIQQIFQARNLFYHPAQGIIGVRVYLYIRRNRLSLISQLSEAISKNKRLVLETYQDRQQLQYLIHKTHRSECALLVTDEKELIEVIKVAKGLENVYVLLLSQKDRLSFDPQIIKTGSQEGIQEFVRQIPDNTEGAEDESYVESDEEGPGFIQREETEPENSNIALLPGRPLMVIRIPNNQQSKNSLLFENRIKHLFQDQVNFRSYESTQQVRDMDKLEEPLQFLIINDTYLEWTKRMASVEANQKFEILYFTKQKLDPFQDLIQKKRYSRFKIISNRWQPIEEYIVGRASRWSKHKQPYTLKSNKTLHLVLQPSNINIQQILREYSLTHNNEIAKRCVYHFMNLEKQLKTSRLPQGEKTFIILDENKNTLKEFKLANMVPSATPRTTKLLVVTDRQNRAAMHQRTAEVVHNQLEAANFIANITFIEANTQNNIPLVSDNDLSWRFWAKQQSLKNGKCKVGFYSNPEQLQQTIISFRKGKPNEMIWILLQNPADLPAYRAKYGSTENIGFVIEDPQQEEPLQVGDVVISCRNRRELQMYLQNFKKRSETTIPPSVLPQPNTNQILLVTNNQFPIDQQQINYWLSRTHAKVVSFNNTTQLQGILQKVTPSTMVYLVLSQDQDKTFEKTLRDIPNIKRIVVNFMTKQRPVYEHPSVAYIAHSHEQLHAFLANLRYTIRNSNTKIQSQFSRPIINVFVNAAHRQQGDLYFKDHERFNESFKIHYYTNLVELKEKMGMVEDKSHVLVVGSQQLAMQLPKNTQYLVEDMYDEGEERGGKLMATDEGREWMLYLRNLPNKRYLDAQKIKVPCRLFVSGSATESLKSQIQSATKRNSSLAMLSYDSPRQLESYLLSMNPSEKALIIVQNISELPTIERSIQHLLQQYPSRSINILLQSPRNSATSSPLILFSGSNQLLLSGFIENIPYNGDIQQGMPAVNLSEIAPTIVNRVGEPSRFDSSRSRIDQSAMSSRSINTNRSKKKKGTDMVIKFGGADKREEMVGGVRPDILEFRKDAISPIEFVETTPDSVLRPQVKPNTVVNDSFQNANVRAPITTDSLKSYNSKALSFYNVINSSSEPIPKPSIKRKVMMVPSLPSLPSKNPATHLITSQPELMTSKVGHSPSISNSNSQSPRSSRYHQSKISSIPPLPTDQTLLPTLAVFYPQYLADISRYAQYIANNSPSTFVRGYPYSSFSQVKKNLPLIYPQNDKVLILTSDTTEYNDAQTLCEKFPKSRCYPRLKKDLLTEIAVTFNLGWQHRPLSLPYSNPILPDQLVEAEHINIYLPSQFIKTQTDLLSYPVTVRNYRQKDEVIGMLERYYDGGDAHSRGSETIYNILVVQQRDIEELWRLPFVYPKVRMLVLTSALPVKEWFDKFGDVLWLYADNSPLTVMKELDKIIRMDLPKLKQASRGAGGSFPVQHILYHMQSQSQQILSLDLLGYRKRQYLSKQHFEKLVSQLQPHQLGYILLTEDGRSLIEPLPNLTFIKKNKHLASYLKTHYPNSTVVNYENAQDIERELRNRGDEEYPMSAVVLHDSSDKVGDVMALKGRYPFLRVVSVGPSELDNNSIREQSAVQMNQRQTSPSNIRVRALSKATSTTGIDPPPGTIAVRKSSFQKSAKNSQISQLSRKSRVLNNLDDVVSRSRGDVGVYYLCNWLPKKPDRRLEHVNMDELARIFRQKPDQLMIVFSEREEMRKVPPQILQSSRVKLVAVSDQPATPTNLHLRPDQLDQASKHIHSLIASSKCDYIICRDDPTCIPKSTSIKSQYQSSEVFTRTFTNLATLKKLILELKLKSHYLHIVCLGEERQQVQGIVEECKVDRYYIHSVGSGAKVRDRQNIVEEERKEEPRNVWAGLEEKVEYELVGIDDPGKKKIQTVEAKKTTTTGKPVDLIVVSHRNRSAGEEGRKLVSEIIANGGSVQYSNRQELIDNLDQMNHQPVIIALEDAPSPKKDSYIVYNKDNRAKIQTLANMPNNSRVVSDSSALRNMLNSPPTILNSPAPLINLSYHNREPSLSSQSPIISNPRDSPYGSVASPIISLPSSNPLNFSTYQFVRLAYDQSLTKPNRLSLAELALNNKNILAKKYHSKESLKGILKSTPASDCCVVVNNNSALDNEINQYPNATRINQSQFRKMCRNRKNGMPFEMEVIGEVDEDEKQDDRNELDQLNETELENLLRQCEQPRNSIIDQPVSLSEPSRANSSMRLNELRNEVLGEEDPEDQSNSNLKWLEQNLYRFAPILNGDILRLAIPVSDKPLKQHLSDSLQCLVVIRYPDLPYLQSNLSSNSKYPTIVLLPPPLTSNATELQDKFPHIRIIQLAGRLEQAEGVTLSLQSKVEVEYLMRELMRCNGQVDQRVHQGVGKIYQQADKDEFNLLPLGDSQQTVYILYNPHRNDMIRQIVEKMYPGRVTFLPYNTTADILAHYSSLPLSAILLVLSNDEQTETIQSLSTKRLDPYFIRYISNHMRPTINLPYNQRLLYTGFTLQSIANYINNLLNRSYKRIEKKQKARRVQGKRQQPEVDIREQKRYKRKYKPSAFGTAQRFEYFDEKYVPTAESTRDRVSSAERGYSSKDRRNYQLKIRKSPDQSMHRVRTQES